MFVLIKNTIEINYVDNLALFLLLFVVVVIDHLSTQRLKKFTSCEKFMWIVYKIMMSQNTSIFM